MYGSHIGAFNMSKFDKPTKKSENNSNNKGQKNQNNKQKNNNTPNKLGGLSLSSFSKYLNTDPAPMGETKRQDTRKDKVSKNTNKAIVDQATLDDFVEEYVKNKTDSAVISGLLRTQIVEIGKIMEHYFDPAYS